MTNGGAQEVAVDANVLLNLALKSHPFHLQTTRFFVDCLRRRKTIIAPPWWEVESDNALRRMAQTGHVTAAIAQNAQIVIDTSPVQAVTLPGARALARQIADQLRQARVTDSTYIALAQLRGCELWTGDLSLCRNAQSLGLKFVMAIDAY